MRTSAGFEGAAVTLYAYHDSATSCYRCRHEASKTAILVGASAMTAGLVRSKVAKGGCRDSAGDVLVISGMITALAASFFA